MKIGRRIFFELATGDLILDTGERSGSVIETTIEQDFDSYSPLSKRTPDSLGLIQLSYGEQAAEFAECSGYKIDISGIEPTILFSYPAISDSKSSTN